MAERVSELLDEVSGIMGYAGRLEPEAMKAFGGFSQAVLKPGQLDTRTKELIAVALSLASTCEWCITYHAKQALSAGATKEELIEAGMVAVLMAGAPALMHMNLLKNVLEES
ncbi:carboxymuconolactone decarboxylase family protein [Thermoplasmatales archaeon AK]|nr:carboxymuconolactone decarboxylase family protein [Thermoplasmatales archaeon AK]